LPISLGSTNKRYEPSELRFYFTLAGDAIGRQLGVQIADGKELLAADVAFVATPPAALDNVAAALKGYAGIIVSAMVPGAGGYELKRDDGTSHLGASRNIENLGLLDYSRPGKPADNAFIEMLGGAPPPPLLG